MIDLTTERNNRLAGKNTEDFLRQIYDTEIMHIGEPDHNYIAIHRYDDGPQPQLGLRTVSGSDGTSGPIRFMSEPQARILAQILCETYGFEVIAMPRIDYVVRDAELYQDWD